MALSYEDPARLASFRGPIVFPKIGCAMRRKAEAEFLESVLDLFKASRDEFEIGVAIVERSLIRRGGAYPFQFGARRTTDKARRDFG